MQRLIGASCESPKGKRISRLKDAASRLEKAAAASKLSGFYLHRRLQTEGSGSIKMWLLVGSISQAIKTGALNYLKSLG